MRHRGLFPVGVRPTFTAFNSPLRIQCKTVCSLTLNRSQTSRTEYVLLIGLALRLASEVPGTVSCLDRTENRPKRCLFSRKLVKSLADRVFVRVAEQAEQIGYRGYVFHTSIFVESRRY